MTQEIPVGLCQCGCGLPAPIASKTCTARGCIKGQPIRYIKGHAAGRHELDPRIQAAKDLACRRRYKAESKARGKAYVAEWLKTHPCVDCGEADPVVLQLHHRNPEEKTATISDLITRQHVGNERLAEEIKKCDVLCANCHLRRHAADGWKAMKSSLSIHPKTA